MCEKASFIDKTDRMILDLLEGDARMSFRELGDQIGMSQVASEKRVQKLGEMIRDDP